MMTLLSKTRSTVTLFITTIVILYSITAQSGETKWRKLDPNNTVLMTLPYGNVVFELAPQYAPNHVAQFKRLIKQGLYNNDLFYRVIDGFVAQAGPKERRDHARTLKIESEWQPTKDWSFTLVQKNDLFAPQTGFVNGFAVGYSEQENKAWLTHCPGVLAMARSNDADSGSSHFYITIGQAPRYLDRIMTIFGRVVYGMNNVQAITRTAVLAGERAVATKDFTRIVNMQIMADVPKEQQIIVEVEQTQGKKFRKKLANRLARKSAFFYKKPPKVLDICQVPVLSRLVSHK